MDFLKNYRHSQSHFFYNWFRIIAAQGIKCDTLINWITKFYCY